ncbi:carbonic anhydrase [Capnocytophaga catalasegens]|uniref:Carbonic anhydrase 2 n=1 Tax=Capnocytophaga catalasegens TaxID=1004260 RepID=A0AAV5AUK7_9FLAO|nr:carbonic anhydrase [Capnocytophaga catalasegens]GIZ16347.1 carbonic anhydrase [Capnocytophaga catalasegens]GJM49127.1 carbonic anhydrase [Capnocytophaga catalasegens]GJM53689.1 carbonic anhydrase [Capnocytophaga catalasegens]
MSHSYKKIFDNNREWIAQKLHEDADFFEKMNEGQSPEYLYIGCSDSRVTAEELMGLKPGEVFVHRNLANMVNALDMSATSVVNYAVSNLKVKHIIVCGHYDCGGVKAAMESKNFGILNPWLRNIRDVYRLHKDELNNIEDQHQRYNRLIELNVEEQCINVIKMACVQERYIEEHYPMVHGWVFDIKTGKLIDLKIDFENILKDVQKIYDLTNSEWTMSKRFNKNLK